MSEDVVGSEDAIGGILPLPVDAGGSATHAFVPVEGGIPIPGFQLVRCLGKGGFGEVWQATGPGGFAIAMKFLRLGVPAGEFELGALELMKRIRHSNLLGQFGAWEQDGLLIVAMELADGNLQGLLDRAVTQGQPGIPAGELLQYMTDAARGIDYLNEPRPDVGQPFGLQHRDIKPSNLLLVGGCVKVGDFGLVKHLGPPTPGTMDTLTLSYASPECLNGQVSSHSDQYSLAVSYCQLRGNRLPFRGTSLEIMAGHLFGLPDLTMLPVPERAVVARALAKEPAERWPNCRAFVQALVVAMGDNPGAPLPITPSRTLGVDTGEWVKKKLREKQALVPSPRRSRLSRRIRQERETMRFLGLILLALVTCGVALFVLQQLTPSESLNDHATFKTTNMLPPPSSLQDY
jgi:serine/threonine protein kinase